jgi:hypothetical protein
VAVAAVVVVATGRINLTEMAVVAGVSAVAVVEPGAGLIDVEATV